MIYITGDTHVPNDVRKLNTENFPEQKNLTKDDYIIICGDFGGVWNGSKSELHWLEWLDNKPFTTLFIDGNHENFDLLNAYPVNEWSGGKVHVIKNSVIHLMRGQVYELDGNKFFALGGASSHDISDGILNPNDSDFKRKKRNLDRRNAMYRINRISWWEEELPNDIEYAEARSNLAKHNWKVDYVVSHCAPIGISNMMSKGVHKADRLTDFLQEVSEKTEFKHWYFGHYHEYKSIDGKYTCLYNQIVELHNDSVS